MNAIALKPVTHLCMGSGKKPGCCRVLSCRRREVPDNGSSDLYVFFLDEKSAELRVWREGKGIASLRGAGKYSTRVVDATCDGLFTVVFFHHDQGRRLGIALLHHDESAPSRLASDPVDYSSEFESVLMPLLPKERDKVKTSLLLVHRSSMKQTSAGKVVSVLLSTPSGAVYLVIGSLEERLWRRFRLDAELGIPTQIRIQDARVISVFTGRIGSPVDSRIAVSAPTVELALSVLDQTSTAFSSCDDDVNANGGCGRKGDDTASQLPPTSYSLVLHETIFSLDDRDAVVRLSYQSQLFHAPEAVEGGGAVPSCHLYLDDHSQRLAVFVSVSARNYFVHVRRSPLNMELVCSCTELFLTGTPRNVMWLSLPHSQQPDVGRIDLAVVLSQDYHLCATDVFGGVYMVEIGDSPATNGVAFACPPKCQFSDKLCAEGFSCKTHLVQVSENEIMVSNGLLGTSLHVKNTIFGRNVACDVATSFVAKEEPPERRVVSLTRCIGTMEKILRDNKAEFISIVFQQLLPTLQCAFPSQHEVFFVQRVFQGLLAAAPPTTVSEWRVLWGLALILQKMLAKRGRDNSVVYTDFFFICLLEHYAYAHGNTTEREQAMEGFLKVVSGELWNAWQSAKQGFEDDMFFVLDGLAGQLPLVPLVEECVRRMVSVTVLSNGTHVVSARVNSCNIVHTLAAVLLAACLKVGVYVSAGTSGQLCLSYTQTDATAVFVPPHSTLSDEESEAMLALSTDLLCVTSPGNTNPPPCAMALFSMLLSRRYHVVSTFMHMFAIPMAQQLSLLEPICNNRSLLEDCSTAISLTDAELFAKIISDSTPGNILRVLCHGCMYRDCFDTNLWRHLGPTLGEEVQAFVVAALLHAMTDRVIAAQNNYSASVMRALLNDKVKQPLQDASVEMYRRRLGVVLSRLEAVWAAFEDWSPYKAADVAACVLATDVALCGDAEDRKRVLSSGSVVSRTVVLCFRLLSLIRHSYRSELHIIDLLQNCRATDDSSVFNVASELLLSTENLKGTALPVESLHWRCVDFVLSLLNLCSDKPRLAGMLLELLELSGGGSASIASLKQSYCAAEDQLRALVQANGGEASKGALAAKLKNGKTANVSTALMNACASSEVRYFMWSKSAGGDVPRWPWSHDMEAHRYIVNLGWVDVLWPVERVPCLLKDCLNSALEGISIVSKECTPQPVVLSSVFSSPLFQHLCVMSPPVRAHALLATRGPGDAVADLASNVPQTSTASADQPSASLKCVHFPAEKETKDLPPATRTSRLGTSDEKYLTTDSSVTSTLHNLPAQTEVRGALTDIGGAKDTAVSVHFPPECVAWWEAGGAHFSLPKQPHSVELPQDVMDTDTSYTTQTTEQQPLAPVALISDVPGGYHQPHRCRRHVGRHHRCAKHGGQRPHDKGQCPQRHQWSASQVPINGGSTTLLDRKETTSSLGLLRLHEVPRPSRVGASVPLQDKSPRQMLRRSDPNGMESLAPSQLLSLREKLRAPRVKLFSWGSVGASKKETDGEGGLNLPLQVPSHALLGASMAPPQILQPPALPSSVVMVRPPALLTLNTPAKEKNFGYTKEAPMKLNTVECVAQQEDRRIDSNEELIHDASPSRTSSTPDVVRISDSSKIKHPLRSPSVMAERDAPLESIGPACVHRMPYPSSLPSPRTAVCGSGAETHVMQPSTMKKEVETNTVNTTLVVPPCPALREPVLSPLENAAFLSYVDDLKAKAVSVPTPVPLPLSVTVAGQPASTKPAAETASASPPNTNISEHNELLAAVKLALAEHEHRQAKHFQSVIEAVRSDTKEPVAGSAVETYRSVGQPHGGLSALEQAELVRTTVRQQNRLMTLNQELLELYSRAQRLGTTSLSMQASQLPVSDSSLSCRDGHFTERSASTPRIHSTAVSQLDGRVTASDCVQIDGNTKETTNSLAMNDVPPPRGSTVEHSMSAAPPDSCLTMDVNNVLHSMKRINAELLRANATADDMERAIQESQRLLQAYPSLDSAYASSREGSAMIEEVRRKTAALEQQLVTVGTGPERLCGVSQHADCAMALKEPLKQYANNTTVLPVCCPEGDTHSTAVPATTEPMTSAKMPSGSEQDGSSDGKLAPPPAQPVIYDFCAQTEEKLLPDSAIGTNKQDTYDPYPENLPMWSDRGATGRVFISTQTFPLSIDVPEPSCSASPCPPPPHLITVERPGEEGLPSRKSRSPQMRPNPLVPTTRAPAKSNKKTLIPERFAMYAPTNFFGSSKSCARLESDARGVVPLASSSLSNVMPPSVSKVVQLHSRREKRRRDTLTAHLSRRLEELQKAFP
ncbi:hypothetical protein TRVL_02200 [Trypanosoma vivax]|nr:hypothetical protein TRVL_02200 [Trypanosoma vivax]